LPFVYVLDRSLDGQRLHDAVETAFKAHPTLFTRIELGEDGEPVQTLDMANEQWSLNIEDIEDIEQEKARFVEPFNIYGDRLFRFRLMRDKEHYYFMVDFHHIIMDGASFQILMQDIDKAYRGEPIAPEELTMMDVANHEAEQRKTPAFDEAKRNYRVYLASHLDIFSSLDTAFCIINTKDFDFCFLGFIIFNIKSIYVVIARTSIMVKCCILISVW
jgi:NRPS condensation-like uncharacterized protein